MAKRAFITGITGQDGAYLSRFLLEKGYEVHGGSRRTSASSTARLKELGVIGDVVLHDFELLELTNIQNVLDSVAPDEIYNLAAQSFVGTSFQHPVHSSDISALGTMRLLECLRHANSKARFYQASTSELFGLTPSSPQNETTPFHPRSPYGIAKMFAHWSTVNYRETFGIHACSGILFNHESPLRGSEFVTRKISLGLAKIKYGRGAILELGNLDARRDWGFAGDYVEGMWRMLQQPAPEDFVLATGQANSIRSFAEHVAATIGWNLEWRGTGLMEEGIETKSGKVLIRVNPAYYRPSEIDVLVGDPAKAREKLNWRHQVDCKSLAEMMANADARKIRDTPGLT